MNWREILTAPLAAVNYLTQPQNFGNLGLAPNRGPDLGLAGVRVCATA